MSEPSTDFVIRVDHWEDQDYVISIRPTTEKSWNSLVIGSCLSKAEAALVSRWLGTAITTILKVGINLGRDSNNEALADALAEKAQLQIKLGELMERCDKLTARIDEEIHKGQILQNGW